LESVLIFSNLIILVSIFKLDDWPFERCLYFIVIIDVQSGLYEGLRYLIEFIGYSIKFHVTVIKLNQRNFLETFPIRDRILKTY